MEYMARGAEARLRRDVWLGRDVVVKERVPKGYRHPDLDRRLRNSRIKTEARLMRAARRVGVPTPYIFDIDLLENNLIMEYIEGTSVRSMLNRGERREEICREVGRLVARLHAGGIVHGDLTTSNMIHSSECIYFIDFSLGAKTDGEEQKGVDLHLLMEAFRSAHANFYDEGIGWVLESYRETWKEILGETGMAEAGVVIEKVHEIEKRGRYT